MVDAYKALLAKKEDTYGTYAAPTGAANAILTRNFSATPLELDQLDRKLDRPARGALPSAPSNPRQKMSFEVEFAGSGMAGTAPAWMELLQGCGMDAPTLTAGASAVQKFTAVGQPLSSLSTCHWVGDQRRKGIGARGDISSIDFTAGAYPFMQLALTGLLPPNPFDVQAPGALDFTRFVQPLEFNTDNSEVLLDGYALATRYIRLQANAAVTVRNLVGINYVQRGNHGLKGKIMCEAPSLTDKDFFTSLRVGSLIPLAVTHGTVAGNIIKLDAANLQILGIADNDEDDVLMYELDVQLNINAGQDDLVITTL